MTTPRSRKGCSLWSLLGCGCGAAAMVGILLVFLVLGILALQERRDASWDRASYEQCQRNLLYLRSALNSYRRDHGELPARLEQLLPRYLDTAQRLHCPLEGKGQAHRYRYTPGESSATAPLITCDKHGQGTVALLHDMKLRVNIHPATRRPTARPPGKAP